LEHVLLELKENTLIIDILTEYQRICQEHSKHKETKKLLLFEKTFANALKLKFDENTVYMPKVIRRKTLKTLI
jgi:hypothetical protein